VEFGDSSEILVNGTICNMLYLCCTQTMVFEASPSRHLGDEVA
jgi:hypothetical protein